jgi:hypothetical protein
MPRGERLISAKVAGGPHHGLLQVLVSLPKGIICY